MASSFDLDSAVETKFSIFRRSLHVLAMIQHSDGDSWNASTLANLLCVIPGEEDVSEKKIAICFDKLREMGFAVSTGKGERRVCLERPLSDSEMIDVLLYYMNSAVEEMGIRDCFKSYVAANGQKSLWIIARIYFASLEKKKIELRYRSESSGHTKDYRLHPYCWVFRDGAVYLFAYNEERKLKSLFRLNRISNLEVLADEFDDDAASASDTLRKSLGAFIGDTVHRITLSYPSKLHNRIIEEFGRLELSFAEPVNDAETVSFEACDLISVCRTVFPFAGEVVITEPAEARKEMKRLIEGARDKY
jgi:hypothetical protein